MVVKKEKVVKMIKCQHCLVSDTPKDEMTFDLAGKNLTKKYLHVECYDDYMKKKAFKEKERIELDMLNEAIKEIYGIKKVPSVAFPMLNELRNGTDFYGRYDYKYKEGYSYALIAETFLFCSESIAYANSTKSFNNSFLNAFRYGLAIVCDKLDAVEKRLASKEVQKNRIAQHTENFNDEEEFQSSYKKPSKSSNDITDFLD